MCSSMCRELGFSGAGAASQPVMLLPALSFNSSSSLARCESVSGSTRRGRPADWLAQWLPSRPGQSRSAPAGCVVSAVGSPGPDRPAASLCRSAGPARLARAPGRGSRTGRTGPVAGRCAVLGMLATGHVALAVLCPARRLGFGLASPPTG